MTVLSLNYILYLLKGMGWTLVLSALAFILGGIGGSLVMFARISRLAPLRILSVVYIQIIQGTPLLIVLFVVYFGLSIIGIELPPLVAAGISLVIYCSAFLGEIWRGCVESVPRTQSEAAECLAMTRFQSLIYVILPQAIRIATPPTVGFMVQVVKGTSLASVVGFVELTRAAQILNNSIFEPFLVFGIAGFFYFLICYPLSAWSRALERKLNVGRS